MPKFYLNLDGDAQSEPPHIYVVDAQGMQVLEIFLEPIPKVDEPDSFNDAHWEYPEVAKKLLYLMNEYS